MSPGWPQAALFCLAGLWLGHTAWRGDDRLWSRLTLTWPVPWPRLTDRTRRLLRASGVVVALALVTAGLLLIPRG